MHRRRSRRNPGAMTSFVTRCSSVLRVRRWYSKLTTDLNRETKIACISTFTRRTKWVSSAPAPRLFSRPAICYRNNLLSTLCTSCNSFRRGPLQLWTYSFAGSTDINRTAKLCIHVGTECAICSALQQLFTELVRSPLKVFLFEQWWTLSGAVVPFV